MNLDLQRRAFISLSTWAACGTYSALHTPAAWAQTATKAIPTLPRLVTVGGAITEVAYLLGAEGQLVGTDTTSVYPPAAERTAKVGYMRQLSAEGLLSLKPDAVVTTTEAGPPVVLDQIRSAGVKVEMIESSHNWQEVQRKVEAVGRLSGRTKAAQALQAKLDAQWEETLKQVAKKTGKRPRVLFILAHGASPSVSGQKTAADSVIRLAGCTNVMTGFDGYRPMTAEAMASAAPDCILTSTQGLNTQGGIHKFWERPELELTPAFKHKALVHMDAMQLLGFGPRLPTAILELHQRIGAA